MIKIKEKMKDFVKHTKESKNWRWLYDVSLFTYEMICRAIGPKLHIINNKRRTIQYRIFSTIPNTFYYRERQKIREYKDKYKGSRCFFVGTGPSLKIEDLDKLEQEKEYTFSLNEVYNLYEETYWRPSFYLFPPLMNQTSERVEQVGKAQAKIASFYPPTSKDARVKSQDGKGIIAPFGWQTSDKMKLSSDISTWIEGSESTVSCAVQIAIYMGFEKMYLVGCDGKHNKEKSYAFEYTTTSEMQDMLLLFNGHIDVHNKLAQTLNCKHKKIEIINATRGGVVDAYKRVNFDELFIDRRKKKLYLATNK